MKIDGVHYRSVQLDGPTLTLIDQPRLPHQLSFVTTTRWEDTANAISTMIVRGAGAIGATGAAGLAQAALNAPDIGFFEEVLKAANGLRHTRPTAQNLFWGIQSVLKAIEAEKDTPSLARQAAVAAAQAVAEDDVSCCERIGEFGGALLADGMNVSTHCNAGWLAAVDWGTALAPIYAAQRAGKSIHVWVDETRPRSQGARLTAFELGQEGVDHTIIADNAIGALMRRGRVDCVIVGADRIAANGDIANKIGTYNVALAAAANGIPFYVAAQTPTIDGECPNGDSIPIEERDQDEVLWTWGWSEDGHFIRVRTAPKTSKALNIAFDVTPAALVKGIITEEGVIEPSLEGIAPHIRK